MSVPLSPDHFIQRETHIPPFRIELREDYVDGLMISSGVPVPLSASGAQSDDSVTGVNSTLSKGFLFDEERINELCQEQKPLEAICFFLQYDYGFFTHSNALKCFEALVKYGYKEESLEFAKAILEAFRLFPLDARFFFSDCFTHIVNGNIDDGLQFVRMLLPHLAEGIVLTVIKDCFEILDKKDPLSAIEFVHDRIRAMDQSEDPLNARLLATTVYARLEKQERREEAERFIQKCRTLITNKDVLASVDFFMTHRGDIQKNIEAVTKEKKQNLSVPKSANELICRKEQEKQDYRHGLLGYQQSIQNCLSRS